MQQLAEAGAGLAPAPVPPARPALADEPGLLQGELDEAVGQGHGVIAAGETVEVADVPAREALAIETQEALDLGRRRVAARGAQTAAIIERDAPPGLVARSPAPHAARVEAEDVGGLQPRDRPTQGAQDHFLDLHGPLHGGRGKHHGHLLGCPWLYPGPPEKRILHLLSGADRSCAPYTPRARHLPSAACSPSLSSMKSKGGPVRRRAKPEKAKSKPAGATARHSARSEAPKPLELEK